ncbi:MAG: putative metal-binding motif-containing protein [Bacteroidetes bacterium]|nr:putative metal-binding motif-containing protein [Bacteroidota bacterium]
MVWRVSIGTFMCLSIGFASQSFGQGNCTSIDLEYICQNTEYVQSVSAECGLACLSAGEEEGEACIEACMLEQLELTTPCIDCFGSQVICVVQNCYFACAFGTEEACAECAVQNCEEGFNSCAGIVDFDGDTWTNLCDCNDNNPAIYPGAEGTGQGFDNNCNGILSPDELTECVADMNADQIVGTADLLIFLGTFDCQTDCLEEADFNNDGVVGASDLLTFLAEFGLFCF